MFPISAINSYTMIYNTHQLWKKGFLLFHPYKDSSMFSSSHWKKTAIITALTSLLIFSILSIMGIISFRIFFSAEKIIPATCFFLFSLFIKTYFKIFKIKPYHSNPTSNLNVTFSSLTCSKVNEKKIHYLIDTLGNKNKWELLINHKSELEKIGREIDCVHPLRFLSIIIKNQMLKASLKRVQTDYFKYSNFIKGLGQKLEKDQNIIPLAKGFCIENKLHYSKIKLLIEKKKWKSFVDFLISNM